MRQGRTILLQQTAAIIYFPFLCALKFVLLPKISKSFSAYVCVFCWYFVCNFIFIVPLVCFYCSYCDFFQFVFVLLLLLLLLFPYLAPFDFLFWMAIFNFHLTFLLLFWFFLHCVICDLLLLLSFYMCWLVSMLFCLLYSVRVQHVWLCVCAVLYFVFILCKQISIHGILIGW